MHINILFLFMYMINLSGSYGIIFMFLNLNIHFLCKYKLIFSYISKHLFKKINKALNFVKFCLFWYLKKLFQTLLHMKISKYTLALITKNDLGFPKNTPDTPLLSGIL
jgi:hypothetical protein